MHVGPVNPVSVTDDHSQPSISANGTSPPYDLTVQTPSVEQSSILPPVKNILKIKTWKQIGALGGLAIGGAGILGGAGLIAVGTLTFNPVMVLAGTITLIASAVFFLISLTATVVIACKNRQIKATPITFETFDGLIPEEEEVKREEEETKANTESAGTTEATAINHSSMSDNPISDDHLAGTVIATQEGETKKDTEGLSTIEEMDLKMKIRLPGIIRDLNEQFHKSINKRQTSEQARQGSSSSITTQTPSLPETTLSSSPSNEDLGSSSIHDPATAESLISDSVKVKTMDVFRRIAQLDAYSKEHGEEAAIEELERLKNEIPSNMSIRMDNFTALTSKEKWVNFAIQQVEECGYLYPASDERDVIAPSMPAEGLSSSSTEISQPPPVILSEADRKKTEDILLKISKLSTNPFGFDDSTDKELRGLIDQIPNNAIKNLENIRDMSQESWVEYAKKQIKTYK